ncbi:MFS transporter [Bacillus sp. B1-b2]|uniref:MFS transporter n=1 Tax=Bacillus sp. B1-b2 TaxID=2653201 RepID=UPI001261AB76|nr:MFS transporter [Bacillus sp. B1-b2]KAB7670708.1 MFS transporter [Bacillus sp. B1-b2]
MNQSKTKLWTKDFIIVSAVNFFLTLVFYLLMVTIAVYAVQAFHASTSQAGLVTGIFIIGTLIGRLFIGRTIHMIGRKRTLIFGLILFSITTSFYFINLGIGFLLFNRFLHGIMLGIASTASGTIIADLIPSSRRGEGIGYFSMSTTLATAIGPFIGLFMSEHTTFPVIFSFCVILGLLSLFIGLLVKVPEIEQIKALSSHSAKSGFHASSFIEPKALPIAIIILFVSLSYSGVLSFINFYAKEIHLVNTASFFFIVYALAILISRPFTGKLMDAKGANYIMYPAIILLSLGLFLLSQSQSSFTFLLSAILIGLGFGNMQSCAQAVAIKRTAAHRLGLATSTYFIFLDAGLGFGPYLLGYVIPITGYAHLYMILGIFSFAVIILYYLLHGRVETKTREPISPSSL